MTVITMSPMSTTTVPISLFPPALTHSLNIASSFQRLLSTTTLFLFLRTYMLSLILLKNSFYVSQVLLLKAFYTSLLVANNSFVIAKEVTMRAWKASESLRKKLFFEFMVFILGGGNVLFLLVFWPGWIVPLSVYGMWVAWG
ncbi:uncharacterized protein RSE6_05661 [Rhynchosporium secalis]|uniref:Uncharacterized protein n=1 Tax=Rhynchosporium secalis TaxID=38038 RepID=A0A1E1M8E0_RHYSE|nr:uncharacterized protein RSE6_05661 [Rhynchosporium secalis]